MGFFGLEESTYQTLARDVDTVYHFAAAVDHVSPYDKLWEANVGGTEQVLRFAVTHHIKHVHFASTVATTSADNGVVSDESRANLDELNSGYMQTKWIAEDLVLQAIDLGMPCTV